MGSSSELSFCQSLHAACYLTISAQAGLRCRRTTDRIYTCKGERAVTVHFLDNWAGRTPTGSLYWPGGVNRPLAQADLPEVNSSQCGLHCTTGARERFGHSWIARFIPKAPVLEFTSLTLILAQLKDLILLVGFMCTGPQTKKYFF